MNILASFLGDSVRTFFRRSEVRKAILGVVNSGGGLFENLKSPAVQIIPDESGVFQEGIRVEATNSGRHVIYGSNFYQVKEGTVSLTSSIELTRVAIDIDMTDGVTPGVKEVVITASDYITTDGYDNSGIYIKSPTLEFLTFSPNVRYLGIPETSTNGYIEFKDSLPVLRGQSIVYIDRISYNLDVLPVNIDLTNSVPVGCVINDYEFFSYSVQNNINSFITPACTIKNLSLNNYSNNGEFALTTLDLSNTTFIYDGSTYIDFFPGLTNIILLAGSEMPFGINFRTSPNINWDDVEELLQRLIDMNGTNNTKLWVGEIYMDQLPEPTEAALLLINVLINRGATVIYTQQQSE